MGTVGTPARAIGQGGHGEDTGPSNWGRWARWGHRPEQLGQVGTVGTPARAGNLYLDLQGYQQFVQRLPLDVALCGEFQESHYWGTVAAISKSRTLKREMDFAAT